MRGGTTLGAIRTGQDARDEYYWERPGVAKKYFLATHRKPLAISRASQLIAYWGRGVLKSHYAPLYESWCLRGDMNNRRTR